MTSGPTRFQGVYAFTGFVAVNLIAGLILLELLSWLMWSGYHWFRPEASYQSEVASPAYEGASWAQELNRESLDRMASRRRYFAFRLWGLSEWHGKYINIDVDQAGAWRRSLNPIKEDCKNQTVTTVWVLGGSAAFGTGVPDWATVPSYLSQALNRAGHGCVVVRNFGVEAYVTTQELILLTEELKRGGRPAIVILYDGFNDAFAGMYAPDPRAAHYAFYAIRDRVQGSLWARFDFLQNLYSVRVAGAIREFFQPHRQPASGVDAAKVVATVDNYEENLSLIEALSRAYKFKLYCFWQPAVFYGHKPLVPYEQHLASAATCGRMNVAAMAAVYEEADRRAKAGVSFVDLAGLFRANSSPLYLDEAHLGPRGNELVANAIANYMQEYPDGTAAAVPAESAGSF